MHEHIARFSLETTVADALGQPASQRTIYTADAAGECGSLGHRESQEVGGYCLRGCLLHLQAHGSDPFVEKGARYVPDPARPVNR